MGDKSLSINYITSSFIRNKRLQEQLDKSKAKVAELNIAGVAVAGGGTGGGGGGVSLNTITEETAGDGDKTEKKLPRELKHSCQIVQYKIRI